MWRRKDGHPCSLSRLPSGSGRITFESLSLGAHLSSESLFLASVLVLVLLFLNLTSVVLLHLALFLELSLKFGWVWDHEIPEENS